ncbi:MAG: acetyl-CoA decarbonylase/synthase complex subunit alpha, partial [Candidatus Altiarchaeales archaeon HGW-Altiarchaeales-3]
SWCPQDIPLVSAFTEVYMDKFKDEKAKISPGRGAIQDVEIREVGMPIVMGEIPGIIAPVGCSLWPRSGAELGDIIEEFLKRNYIVTTSGCSAMALASDYSGIHNLYEKYGGRFAAGNLINVGSCVANAHITGAAMKVANIFAHRKLRANYEEIADYCTNRIGAVGLVLGTMSQKAVSIGFGCMRLGIPVIWGPQGVKYRKELRGDVVCNYENDDYNDIFKYKPDEKLGRWEVYDSFSGEKHDVGPAPEHLSYAAKTKEEIMILIPKLTIRGGDNFKGRQIKLAHWVDMYKKYGGRGGKPTDDLPGDIHKFVRTETDIPITLREEVMQMLKDKNWEPAKKNPDPTLVKRLVRKKKIKE